MKKRVGGLQQQQQSTDSGVDAAKPENAPGVFYLFSSSHAYLGGCGYQQSGIQTFSHMLEALEAQLEWLAGFDRDSDEFVEAQEALERSIAEIQSKGTDKGVEPSWLEFDEGNVAYSTLAAGYWRVFAEQALPILVNSAQEQLDEADGEEDELEGLRKKVSALRDLSERRETEGDSFSELFWDLAEDYEERHC